MPSPPRPTSSATWVGARVKAGAARCGLPDDFDLMLATMSRKKTQERSGRRLGCGGPLGRLCRRRIRKAPSYCRRAIKARHSWSTTISGPSCAGNRSINYAISVGHLADRIAGLPQIATGHHAAHEPLSRDETEGDAAASQPPRLQRRLSRRFTGSPHARRDPRLPGGAVAAAGRLSRTRLAAASAGAGGCFAMRELYATFHILN